MAAKKAQIIQWLLGQGVEAIDESLAFRAAAEYPVVSRRTLRAAMIESGLKLTPMVEGVRQESAEQLARTLLALAAEYEAGDAPRRRQVRAAVIEARQHAVFAARIRPKEEDLLWLRVWLENPPLFAEWLELRRRACADGEHAV